MQSLCVCVCVCVCAVSKSAQKNKRKKQRQQNDSGRSQEQKDAVSMATHLMGGASSQGQSLDKEKRLKNLRKVSWAVS